MKSIPRGVGAATIALAFALPVSAQTLLRLAPPEGQVSRYVYSMEVTMENPMMPTSGPVLSVRADQTRTILSVIDEVITARATIDSAATTVNFLGAPPRPDLSGIALEMNMDARGIVLNIDAEQTRGGEVEEAARGLLEGSMILYQLPEAEVGSGDSWTAGVSVPLAWGGPAEVELTYTLTSLEDGRATITFAGPVEASLDVGGMPANISGELNGSMIVDLAAGRYVRQESLMALEMAVSGMAMPMGTTMTLELVTDPS